MLALSLPLAALAQEAKPAEKKPEGVQVKPYGFVLGNLFWTTETFATRDYPGQVARNDVGGAFLGSARQSRFGVRLSSSDENWTGATLAGVIEFDFKAGHLSSAPTAWYNGVMRLRLAAATATWKLPTGSFAVMVGQEYGLVNPLFGTSLAWVADPIYWQAGNIWRRTPQARATYTGNYGTVGVSLAAAILSPQDGNSNPAGTPTDPSDDIVPGAVDFGAGNLSRRPDIEARLALSVKPAKDITGTIGVGYHLGNRRYLDGTDVDTNLIGVDVEANLTKFVLLRGEWYMGEGTEDNYFGIFSPGVSNSADHIAVQSDGFWAQAVLKPTDLVWVTAGYGMGSADEDDLTDGGYAATTRKENSQLTGGVIVNMSKAWKVGLEAMKVETTYLDDEERDAFQVAFSSQLVF